MTVPLLALASALVTLSTGMPEGGPAHPENPVYRDLLDHGWTADGVRVRFPAPTLADGATPADEAAALRTLAPTASELAELTRVSVSAPLVLRTRDVKTPGGVVRQGDLWFVLRASLDAIEPDKAAEGVGEGKPVEAGNMRFSGRRLDASTLEQLRIGPTAARPSGGEWYVHLTSRLLDRLHVEATDRIVATRSESSWTFASITDPRFDQVDDAPNRWWPIERQGGAEKPGAATVYAGGASYVKLSRLATVEGALLVEAHFAFHEPHAWFDGAPILRSKIGLIVQDRVRSVRRELARPSQEADAPRSSGNRPERKVP